ncbi:hypothetical protein BH10PSE9_BH10PSE9_20090 [soil metagenome]
MTTRHHSILQSIAGMVGRVAAARRSRQTSIILGGLPDHIRKDIGYGGKDLDAPRVIGSTWPY